MTRLFEKPESQKPEQMMENCKKHIDTVEFIPNAGLGLLVSETGFAFSFLFALLTKINFIYQATYIEGVGKSSAFSAE